LKGRDKLWSITLKNHAKTHDVRCFQATSADLVGKYKIKQGLIMDIWEIENADSGQLPSSKQ